ncbi:MAG: GNAT family N-acetyltransferase [Chloroflexi bacterium]|nr:GNAT family N-acetyltransferase [Chloroflexota bacterium]
MVESDIDSVVNLIARAMNLDEGNQARDTFAFHFSCKRYGIDDGRTYYVLPGPAALKGIAGLHHYHWGPQENVWLAWFALDPSLHGQGLGKFLLEAVATKARGLGFTKFFIETYSTPAFARARAFYQAQGFTQAGSIHSYLPDGGNMVVFSKDLTIDA